MALNINKLRNWNGAITGDLVKECQINFGNKDKLEKDYGDNLYNTTNT